MRPVAGHSCPGRDLSDLESERSEAEPAAATVLLRVVRAVAVAGFFLNLTSKAATFTVLTVFGSILDFFLLTGLATVFFFTSSVKADTAFFRRLPTAVASFISAFTILTAFFFTTLALA
ncbi:MAG: hypothetical protein K2O66_05140, partial [Bacteroidales bacterium]|nr:hypothetical protein [Bacteroidales bacterium]